MRAQTAKRGLLVLVLAYLFRLQEHILAGFWGGWSQVFRVDILNCIGASLLVLALVGVPREGRPAYLPALLAPPVFVGLGPIVGPAVTMSRRWIPRADQLLRRRPATHELVRAVSLGRLGAGGAGGRPPVAAIRARRRRAGPLLPAVGAGGRPVRDRRC